MTEYHKINTIFKRDMESQRKTLIVGQYSEPVFEYLAGNQWQFTEKVDGTNVRVMIQSGAVSFGGRTDNASMPAPLVKRLQERFLSQIENLMSIFPDGGCLYGEGYGGKIQGGGKYLPEQDFVLFDVKIGEYWLDRINIEDVAARVGLETVPLIGVGTLHDAVNMVRRGFNSRWGDFLAEGIVARPTVELKTHHGTRVIAKLKHRDFEALA
jgi:hypothetical protein